MRFASFLSVCVYVPLLSMQSLKKATTGSEWMGERGREIEIGIKRERELSALCSTKRRHGNIFELELGEAQGINGTFTGHTNNNENEKNGYNENWEKECDWERVNSKQKHRKAIASVQAFESFTYILIAKPFNAAMQKARLTNRNRYITL